jgi:hAT family C-terminal dimerisation region
MTSRSAKRTELLLQKQSEQESVRLLRMVGDIPIRWNSTYDMILRAMRLRIPLRNWLDEEISLEPDLERLALSPIDWKKLKYLIILLRPFAEYTSLIGNTRDATINHTWNVYNALFDHLDMMREQFCHKSIERTPWISEFIKAVDTGSAKLKEYYSKTGGPVETQYALAALLDPSQKLSIFAAPEWGRPWSRKYTKEFVGHWSTNYRKLAVIKDNQPQSSTAPQSLNSIFRQHRQSIGPSRVSTVAMNEAEQYLQAPLIGEDSETPVLQLWKRIEPSYPSLATMARDILAVPGMSMNTLNTYAQRLI